MPNGEGDLIHKLFGKFGGWGPLLKDDNMKLKVKANQEMLMKAQRGEEGSAPKIRKPSLEDTM
jgi:hypothetical protein